MPAETIDTYALTPSKRGFFSASGKKGKRKGKSKNQVKGKSK